MWNPKVLLSFSAVFAAVGLAAVLLAAISTHWVEYNVNRREIINAFNREPELNLRLKDAFLKDPLYFSRHYGLFHTCFSDAVPSDIGSFSWIDDPCVYQWAEYMPSERQLAAMSTEESTHLWIMRVGLILYVAGIAIGVASLMVGVIGCWSLSPRTVLATAIIMIIAVALLGMGMGAWHYAQYMEKYTLEQPPFYRSWESILKSTSGTHYGLSYIASWVGITCLFIGALFMLVANCSLKEEEEKAYEAKHDAYMIPNYYDKGAGAMMPYYNTYTAGAYGAYPPYGTYGAYPNAYYGYMTYGR